jgi:hypothetical protein
VARALLELLTHASPPGLHAGQIDPNSDRHLGNSPSLLALALINAAT